MEFTKKPNRFKEVMVDNFDAFNYEPPVKVLVSELHTQVESDVLRAVRSIGVDVDKDELLRALQYDREQYTRGYSDGYVAGYSEGMTRALDVTRCKDCKHCATDRCMRRAAMRVNSHDFCSFGERRESYGY